MRERKAKKGSSFFVKMAPPKNYRSRVSEFDKQKSIRKSLDEEPGSSVPDWHSIITEDNSGQYVQNDTSERKYHFDFEDDDTAPDIMDDPEFENRSADIDTPDLSSRQRVQVLSPELKKTILLIRIALATLFFAAAILFGRFSLVFFVASALIAGYDILIKAADEILSGIFMPSSILSVLVVICAFILDYCQEAAAAVILLQTGLLLSDILSDAMSRSALGAIDKRDENLSDVLSSLLANENSGYLHSESVMRRSIKPVFLVLIVLTILYAILLPLLTYYRISVIVHRALCVLLISNPLSVVASFRIIGMTGMCSAASAGIVFRNASSLENIDNSRTLILDKTGIFNAPEPEVLALHSDRFDEQTFIKLLCHVMHDSSQIFAQVFTKKYSDEYDDSLVTVFDESAGGITAEINGMPVLVGTESFVNDRGLPIPEKTEEDGISYFVYISGRYAGNFILSSEYYGDISDIIHEFRLDGINKCILITSETAEDVSKFAVLNGFDEVYAGISDENKDSLLEELSESNNNKTILVTSDDAVHPGSIDNIILIGNRMNYADAFLQPEHLPGISILMNLSERMNQIAFQNAMISFAVKGIIIFLSLTGNCNLWIAMTGDIAAMLFTIFYSKRLMTKSVLKAFINK